MTDEAPLNLSHAQARRPDSALGLAGRRRPQGASHPGENKFRAGGVVLYPRDFSFIYPTEVTGIGKALNLFAAEKTSVLA